MEDFLKLKIDLYSHFYNFIYFLNLETEIKNHPPHELAISALTLMEIEYGLILCRKLARGSFSTFTIALELD